MNPELEALIRAYDDYTQSRDLEAARLEAIYQNRLDELLARRPSLSREALHQSIRLAHLRWIRPQANRPSTLPPKA